MSLGGGGAATMPLLPGQEQAGRQRLRRTTRRWALTSTLSIPLSSVPGKGVERLAAAGAGALALRQVADLLDDGQAGVVAALGSGLAGLLAARLLGSGRGGRGGLAGVLGRLALLAEELLLAEQEQGAQGLDLGLEVVLAGARARWCMLFQ